MARKTSKTLGKDTLSLVAERFKVLSDPLRLQILQELRLGERSVNEIVEATGAAQANVSRHLQILARARIVDRRKQGLHAFYRVADPTVLDLCAVVCNGLEESLARDLDSVRGNPDTP